MLQVKSYKYSSYCCTSKCDCTWQQRSLWWGDTCTMPLVTTIKVLMKISRPNLRRQDLKTAQEGGGDRGQEGGDGDDGNGRNNDNSQAPFFVQTGNQHLPLQELQVQKVGVDVVEAEVAVGAQKRRRLEWRYWTIWRLQKMISPNSMIWSTCSSLKFWGSRDVWTRVEIGQSKSRLNWLAYSNLSPCWPS